jgi:hypothetical protein
MRKKQNLHHDLNGLEMNSRLNKLERESRLRFIVQFIVAPIVVAGIGIYFNFQIEKTKSDLQRLEVDAKRVDTVKGMLPELFSDTPERALIAEAVVTTIVDEHAKKIIQNAVQAWVKSRIDNKFDNAQLHPEQTTAAISAISNAAQEINSQSAKVVQDLFTKPDFYTIVASEKNKDAAIKWAKKFQTLNYAASVYSTTNPYYAVVIGVGTFVDAKGKGFSAVAAGHAKEYFILPRKYIREKIYPL